MNVHSLFPSSDAARCRHIAEHIDRVRSYAGLVNLQVPRELEAKLTRQAAETGRRADDVALDLWPAWWTMRSGRHLGRLATSTAQPSALTDG